MPHSRESILVFIDVESHPSLSSPHPPLTFVGPSTGKNEGSHSTSKYLKAVNQVVYALEMWLTLERTCSGRFQKWAWDHSGRKGGEPEVWGPGDCLSWERGAMLLLCVLLSSELIFTLFLCFFFAFWGFFFFFNVKFKHSTHWTEGEGQLRWQMIDVLGRGRTGLWRKRWRAALWPGQASPRLAALVYRRGDTWPGALSGAVGGYIQTSGHG